MSQMPLSAIRRHWCNFVSCRFNGCLSSISRCGRVTSGRPERGKNFSAATGAIVELKKAILVFGFHRRNSSSPGGTSCTKSLISELRSSLIEMVVAE